MIAINPSSCPSDLVLDRWLSGELDHAAPVRDHHVDGGRAGGREIGPGLVTSSAADTDVAADVAALAAHVAGCPRCRERRAAFERYRERFLARHPFPGFDSSGGSGEASVRPRQAALKVIAGGLSETGSVELGLQSVTSPVSAPVPAAPALVPGAASVAAPDITPASGSPPAERAASPAVSQLALSAAQALATVPEPASDSGPTPMRSRWHTRKLLVVAPALLAAVAVLVAVRAGSLAPESEPAPSAESSAVIGAESAAAPAAESPETSLPLIASQTKGRFRLQGFVEHDGAAMAIVSGAEIAPGQPLQLMYSSQQSGYGAVLGRDGAGQIGVFWSDGSHAAPVAVGERLSLPHSIVFDHTPGTETLIAVRCPHRFALSPLEAALAAPPLGVGPDALAQALREQAPGCQVVHFALQKAH